MAKQQGSSMIDHLFIGRPNLRGSFKASHGSAELLELFGGELPVLWKALGLPHQQLDQFVGQPNEILSESLRSDGHAAGAWD